MTIVKNRKKGKFKNYLFYTVFLIIMFALQTTPSFLRIKSVEPFLMIPAMVLIPIFEDEFIGGIFGAFSGFLCDTSSFLIFGLNAALFLIIATTIGLIIKFWLQPSFLTHLIFSALAVFVVLNIYFVFSYGIWRLDVPESLYIRKVVATTVYTTLISPVIYIIFKKLAYKFNLFNKQNNQVLI